MKKADITYGPRVVLGVGICKGQQKRINMINNQEWIANWDDANLGE